MKIYEIFRKNPELFECGFVQASFIINFSRKSSENLLKKFMKYSGLNHVGLFFDIMRESSYSRSGSFVPPDSQPISKIWCAFFQCSLTFL